MYTGKLVIAQVRELLLLDTFLRCVHAPTATTTLRRRDFALLTYRESLREIEVFLQAQNKKLYHMDIRSRSPAALWPILTKNVTGGLTPVKNTSYLKQQQMKLGRPSTLKAVQYLCKAICIQW